MGMVSVLRMTFCARHCKQLLHNTVAVHKLATFSLHQLQIHFAGEDCER